MSRLYRLVIIFAIVCFGVLGVPKTGNALELSHQEFDPGGFSGYFKYTLGVGLGLAYPVLGPTARFYFSERIAAQTTVGTSPGGFAAEVEGLGPIFHLTTTYHPYNTLILGYTGAGFAYFRDTEGAYEWAEIGGHLTLGIAAQFLSFPADVSLEWKPGLYTDLGNSGGNGGGFLPYGFSFSARYYFF